MAATFGEGSFGGSRSTFGGVTTALPVLGVVLAPAVSEALTLTPLQEKS
jgi:hypothetical protein